MLDERRPADLVTLSLKSDGIANYLNQRNLDPDFAWLAPAHKMGDVKVRVLTHCAIDR